MPLSKAFQELLDRVGIGINYSVQTATLSFVWVDIYHVHHRQSAAGFRVLEVIVLA